MIPIVLDRGDAGPSLRRARSSIVSRSAIAAVIGMHLACAEPPRDAATAGEYRVRDSAGVQIVEVPSHLFEGLPTWTLSEDPVLRIGRVDGPEEEVFGGINHVARFEDGGLAILDRLTQEIRAFSSEGRFERSFGGMGEGPGEFDRAMNLDRIRGDSLAVFDPGTARVTVLSREGRVVREYSTLECRQRMWDGSESRCLRPSGILGDGALVSPDRESISRPPEGGGHRPVLTMGIGTVGPDGSFLALDTVGQIPAFVPYRGGDPIGVRPFPQLYGASPTVSASLTHVVVARGDQRNIRFWTPDGRLDRVVRLDPPRPVTEDDLGIYGSVEWTDAEEEAARIWLEESTPADVVPLFGDSIIHDTAGRLWLKEYVPARLQPDSVPKTWIVLGDDGRPQGRIELPDHRFYLQQIDEDAVVAIEFDSLDLSYAVVYGIMQGGDPAAAGR